MEHRSIFLLNNKEILIYFGKIYETIHLSNKKHRTIIETLASD